MADYVSNYTGAEIDEGIAKANTALQSYTEQYTGTIYYQTGYYDETSGEYETGIPGETFKIDSPITKQDISDIDAESITETVNKWLQKLEFYGYPEDSN